MLQHGEGSQVVEAAEVTFQPVSLVSAVAAV